MAKASHHYLLLIISTLGSWHQASLAPASSISSVNNVALQISNGNSNSNQNDISVENAMPLEIAQEATTLKQNSVSSTTLLPFITNCGIPVAIDHGVVSCNGGYLLGATCTYSCDPAFSLSSASSIITCQANGSWSSSPTCVPITCSPPPAPEHGNVSCPAILVPQSQCNFTCDAPYRLTISAISTCLPNGTMDYTTECALYQ